jgi:HEAT repeat protein
MKLATLLCTAAAVLLVSAGLVRAAETDAGAILKELKGDAEPVKRSAAALDAAYAQALAALLPDMGSDDLGKRGNSQGDWSKISLRASRPGAEDERAAACKAMLPSLGADTPQTTRVWLIRQLQLISKAESVAALVALLNDKDALVRESARRAVQVNPAPAAGQALLAALPTADTPAWRVAIINAVAARKDPAAAPAIARYLSDNDESIQLAAAAGLGKIGGAAAAAALGAAKGKATGKLLPVVLDAYLLCADQFVAADKKDAALPIYEALYAANNPDRFRIAALRGLVLVKGEGAVPLLTDILTGSDARMRGIALSFMREVPGPGGTKAMAALLPKLGPAAQVDVLNELGSRGDPSTKSAVLAAAKSDDAGVRSAAFKALGGVGGAADIAMLAQVAAVEGPERDAARFALDHLRGAPVDQAMVSGLATADAKTRPEIIRSLAARRTATATPAVARYVDDADAATRLEAIKALETLGDDKVAGLVIGAIVKAKQDDERQAAEKTLGAIGGRAPDKEAAADTIVRSTATATGQAKASLLRALGKIGGAKALAAIKANLKDADAAVQDAAFRTLADWPDGAAAADLLELAKTETKPANQVLALRGYVRLITVGDRPAAEKVTMCQEALAAAKRPDEKRLVLGPLADLKTLAALKLAAPLMDEQGVKEEAASAAVKIAKAMGNRLAPEVADAMEKAITVTKNDRVKKDAQDVLKKITQPKK